MSLSSWKQFSFLHYVPLRDPNFDTDAPLFSDHSLSYMTASDECFFMVVEQSKVRVITNEFKLLYEFVAFDDPDTSIKHIQYSYVNNMKVLGAIAEKSGAPNEIKLWNLDKLQKNTTSACHDYLTSVKVMNGTNKYPIVAMAVSNDFSVGALGYGNGVTVLIRGNLLADKGAKQRVIYHSEHNDPITGLHFFENSSLLYVLTTGKILLFETSGRSQDAPLKIIDKISGADLNCSTLLANGNLALTNFKANLLDFYSSKFGKVNSVELPKNLMQNRVYNFKDKYILLIASLENDFTETIETTSPGNFQTTRILILDHVHNFVVFNLTLSNRINHVMTANGSLYLLSSTGIMYKITEKDLKEKLDILVQRDLYTTALQLLNENNENDKESILSIRKQYADYLYSQNELQSSVEQYIECTKLSGPNHALEIILKFKDSDKILYLTEYLETLCFDGFFKKQILENDNKDEDYLTLLLCNYCKLKDKKKLEQFLNQLEILQKNTDDPLSYDHLNFNLDLVLDLLLKINFNTITLRLAFIFNHVTMVLSLLVNVFENHQLCIDFLRSLEVNDIFNVLLNDESDADYIKILLVNNSMQTTKFLIDIFTGVYKPTFTSSEIYERLSNAENKNMLSNGSTSKEKVQSYSAFLRFFSSDSAEPTYQPPKPRLVFLSFVENPNEFVVFLEACLESYSKFDEFNTNTRDKSDLLITLFEMYLNLSNHEDEDQEYWEHMAFELYRKNKDLMDHNTVLLLCHVNEFFNEDLLLSIDEEPQETAVKDENVFKFHFSWDTLPANLKKYELPVDHPTLQTGKTSKSVVTASTKIEQLRSALNSENIAKVVELLNLFGDKVPELYSMTLFFVVKKNSEHFLCEKFGLKNFLFVLNKILQLNLVSIIDLINILSINEMIKFSFIKDFLMKYSEFKQTEIDKNRKLYEYYSNEIEHKKKEISKLIDSEDNFIVINNLNCDLCNQSLDFPVAHFMCSHSYHQRCLNDFEYDSYMLKDDSETLRCPKCISELEAVNSLRKNQEEVGEKVDLFKIALEESEDKLKVIHDFFGRGAMEGSSLMFLDKKEESEEFSF